MFNKFLDKLIIFLFTTFRKIGRYFYFQNFVKKHITYGFVNGKFQITSTSHEDFIKTVQQKINKFKTEDRKEFIKLALIEALSGCNFIIFSQKGNDKNFIQFWTAEHNLEFNFYANKINELNKFYLLIVGLLSESGFVNEKNEKYKGSMIYKVDKGKDYVSIDANFKKDIEKASWLVANIFKQVYKIGKVKLTVKVE